MNALRWSSAFLCCLCLMALAPIRAEEGRDHDRARAALKAGELLPLQDVLKRVQRSHPGEVLEVELERDGGRWVYELKVLQPGGLLLRLDVDGKTATILRSRARPALPGKTVPASAASPEKRP